MSTNQHNNNRRCHARNHHQQEVILDFLASMNKNKVSPWESFVNKVNEDWSNMMEETENENPSKSSKENPSNKQVTWKENLLDIKTISPRQCKVLSANIFNAGNLQILNNSF